MSRLTLWNCVFECRIVDGSLKLTPPSWFMYLYCLFKSGSMVYSAHIIFFKQVRRSTRNRQLHITIICDVETGQSSGSSDEAGYRSQPRQLNVKEF